MKNKICFILVFLIAFFSGTVSCVGKLNIGMDKIEEITLSLSEFYENGAKIQYETNSNKYIELRSIQNNIKKFYKSDAKITDDQIVVDFIEGNIKANVYNNDGKTSVEIEIINYNKEKKISNLMKELTEFQNKNSENIRYFQYVKGKVNNVEGALQGVKKTQEIRNIDTLDIHNGYVGTANICNGERVNFAVNKYDTGSYLIIGTPIIFTTY